MNKLIVLDKYSPSSNFWENLKKRKKIDQLTVEQIVNQYQGFEGELIAYFPLPENTMEIDATINKSLQIKKSHNFLILFIISNSDMPSILQDNALNIGYDVGICEEESIYSSIFNEILFGNLNELIDFKKYLNESLLFPDKTSAQKFVNLHDKLSAQGKDVEDYEEMKIYEIWKKY